MYVFNLSFWQAYALRRVEKLSNWHFYYSFPFVRIDGKWMPGPFMRRRVNGKWEYRPLTEQEYEDYLDRRCGL